MNFQDSMLVPVRTAATIIDEIEEVYDQVTRRAYEIFLERGGIGTLDLEDWLMAEHELLFKPVVQVEETDCRITVTICIEKECPPDLQVLVTPDAMVIQAEANTAGKKIFRTVEFPRRIDVSKAEARYANGNIILTI